MSIRHHIGTTALLFSLGAMPAAAQTSPVGLVDDACVAAPAIPESLRAFVRTQIDPSAPKPPATFAADIAAYRAAADKQKAQDWAELCHYAADNKRVAALPQSARRIVYMGDSLTELWGIADPAFFTGGRINRGVSGQTTGQMLVRFQADVIALHPKAVHIWAGTNDLAGNNGPETMADVQNNIVAMVTLARANNVHVVLASLTPILAFPWRAGLKPGPQVAALNAWLSDYAKRVGATYVDYHTPLATPEGATQPALTFDGVHLSLAGYARIRALSESVSR